MDNQCQQFRNTKNVKAAVLQLGQKFNLPNNTINNEKIRVYKN